MSVKYINNDAKPITTNECMQEVEYTETKVRHFVYPSPNGKSNVTVNNSDVTIYIE